MISIIALPLLQNLIIGDSTASSDDSEASHCFFFCDELQIRGNVLADS